MADNVAITPGSGDTIAADDVSGVKYQAVKLNAGGDGASIPVVAGRQADAASIPVALSSEDVALVGALTETAPATDTASSGLNGRLQRIAQNITTLISSVLHVIVDSITAGENHIGSVGGHTRITNVTMSLDTSAYASGDVIADTQQIDAAFRKSDGSGVLHSLLLNDKDDQGVAFTVYFLSANVSMGTENSAPSITDANADNILGWVDVATADWKDLGGCKVATIRNIGLPVKAVSGTDDLYIAIVNGTGTPTYTATGIVIRVGILED